MAACSALIMDGGLMQRALAQQYRKQRPQRRSTSLLVTLGPVFPSILYRFALLLAVIFAATKALLMLCTFVCCVQAFSTLADSRQKQKTSLDSSLCLFTARIPCIPVHAPNVYVALLVGITDCSAVTALQQPAIYEQLTFII